MDGQDRGMDGWIKMDGMMDGQRGWMGGQMEWMDGLAGWMGGWMDGWRMDGIASRSIDGGWMADGRQIDG